MTGFVNRKSPKAKSPRGTFDFFTYSELAYWLVFIVAVSPFRWKWAPFVFFRVRGWIPLKMIQA